MTEVIICPATQQDLEALYDLYDEFHTFHVRGIPERLKIPEEEIEGEKERVQEILLKLMNSNDAAIFVSKISSKVIGLAEIYLKEDELNPYRVAHKYGYLQSLIVSEKYRNSGLGAKLVETAEKWAREKGATEMQLDTWEFPAGPLPFYEKAGYTTLKRNLVKSL